MRAPMRIACVNQDRGIGPHRAKGAAVHLAAMREAFRRLGCEVLAFDEPDGRQLDAQLRRAHAAASLDLVYERYALGADSAARFAAANTIPLALEVNAPLAEEAARYREHREGEEERDADRRLFGQAALVLAVSKPVADYATRRGAPTERVVLCPNGIDETRFYPALRKEVGRLAGLDEETLVLGFHGRERLWHRFDKLLSCFQALKRKGLPLHLLVVGEGAFTGLDELPESDVTRLAWVPHDEVAAWVARFDILPLTHQPDAPFYFSPLKLSEAMACGVVPVVPDLGELPGQVGNGAAGLVYAAGDMDAMADGITALVEQPGLRARLGAEAARRAARQTWTGIARDVLDRLLSRREAQPPCRTG